MKKARKLWTAAALAVGMGLGFGVAFSPAPAHAGSTEAECVKHSDCDAKCGGPGTGACHAWKCYCLM